MEIIAMDKTSIRNMVRKVISEKGLDMDEERIDAIVDSMSRDYEKARRHVYGQQPNWKKRAGRRYSLGRAWPRSF